MQIILWRHAEAEAGEIDLERGLTEKGRNQAEKMASQLRKKLPESYQLWVSQACRSRQTAEYLSDPTHELAVLNPESDARQIAALFGRIEDGQTVVIVGHQPWIGEVCSFLLNQSWQRHAYWSVKKGAFWWFECQPYNGIYLSKLKIMLAS